MLAAAATAPAVDGCSAAGAAAVGAAATAVDERSHRVEPRGVLSVLTADSKSVMPSKKQSFVLSLMMARLLSVLSKSSLKSS